MALKSRKTRKEPSLTSTLACPTGWAPLPSEDEMTLQILELGVLSCGEIDRLVAAETLSHLKLGESMLAEDLQVVHAIADQLWNLGVEL